jgi:hypothetical protein
MTINEARDAAESYRPVVYEDPFLGKRLFSRIGAVKFRIESRENIARGKAARAWIAECLPMNAASTVTDINVERLRLATAEELWDVELYRGEARMPEVHPELLCPEVKRFQSQSDGKE